MSVRPGAVVTLAVLTGIGLLMVSPIRDPDLWWLLRSGQYMVETRAFPTTDPFSATAQGAEWVNHAWGFELALYGVYRLGGTTGLILLQALFAVATFGLIYRFLRREGVGRGWALAMIALGAMATRGFWSPRPQLVTYLLFAVFWGILREHRDGRADRLAWLPPLTVLWVNLHGGFIIGPALIGLSLVAELAERAFPMAGAVPEGRRLRRLALAGVGCGVAALANPYHYRALLFPFQVLGDKLARDFIVEWASPPFQAPQVMLVEGLLLLTVVLLVLAPRPVRWGDLAVLVAFLHLALQAVRNLPLFVLILLPILGRALADSAPRWMPALIVLGDWARRRLAVAVTAAVVLPLAAWWTLLFPSLAGFVPRFGIVPDAFPAGAVEFLRRERPPGPLFNDYGWGGYLIWSLYPEYRVWIDGRVAVYGPAHLAEHIEITNVRPRWRETLDRHGIGLVLIKPRSPLTIVLRASPEWEVLYEDQVAVVFGRRGDG